MIRTVRVFTDSTGASLRVDLTETGGIRAVFKEQTEQMGKNKTSVKELDLALPETDCGATIADLKSVGKYNVTHSLFDRPQTRHSLVTQLLSILFLFIFFFQWAKLLI